MEGPVFAEARRAAAGLAHVGLCHLGGVTVTPFASGRSPGVGPLKGEGSFGRVLSLLESLRAEGPTRLGPAFRWASGGRRGVAVVLSDFLEAGEWESSIQQVRGHRVVLLHFEAEIPGIQGAALLRDRESGEVIRRTLTEGVLEGHRRRRRDARRGIEEACRRRGAIYLRARPGVGFDEVVLEVLREIA
jgi:uncharacterized protein (DUF58 family)